MEHGELPARLAGRYNNSPTNIIHRGELVINIIIKPGSNIIHQQTSSLSNQHRGFETTNKGIGDTNKEIWEIWTRLAATSTWSEERDDGILPLFSGLLMDKQPFRLYCVWRYIWITWSLVFGTWMLFFHIFPFSWEFHYPNWQTHNFQRGRSTTNHYKQLEYLPQNGNDNPIWPWSSVRLIGKGNCPNPYEG